MHTGPFPFPRYKSSRPTKGVLSLSTPSLVRLLPTYLLTYLLTYLPKYLPTCLVHRYLSTYLPIYLPTHHVLYVLYSTYLTTYLPTHLPFHCSTESYGQKNWKSLPKSLDSPAHECTVQYMYIQYST